MFIKFAKVALPKELKKTNPDCLDAYLICYDDKLKQGWLLLTLYGDDFYDNCEIKRRIDNLGSHKLSKSEKLELVQKIIGIKYKSGTSMTLLPFEFQINPSKFAKIKLVYDYNKSIIMKNKINFLLKNF